MTKTAAALLLALSAALAACGGGGDDGGPAVILDTSRTISGGFTNPANTGSAVVFELLDGPRYTTGGGPITQCITVEWTQDMKKAAGLSLLYTPTGPVNGPAATTYTATAAAAGPTVVRFERCLSFGPLGAGSRLIQERFEMRTNCGCLDALAGFTATVRWRVTEG